MSKNPEWEYVANLGEVNPLDYGGYFIYRDKTGVYSPEGEKYFPEERKVYRFSLDKMSLVDGHLITNSIVETAMTGGYLPYPLNNYSEWFDDDITSVASFIGMTPEDLKNEFCSDDILVRARAYEAIGDYWGYENLDDYPLVLTKKEAEARYKGMGG